MPEPTLYLFTGNPREPIPEGFELATVEAIVPDKQDEPQPHKALHIWTGDGDPSLFEWEVWEGETAPIGEVKGATEPEATELAGID